MNCVFNQFLHSCLTTTRKSNEHAEHERAMLEAKSQSQPGEPLLRDNKWLRFCLGILVLKFVLFGLDSFPKFFGGDSRCYLWTALSGWIPEDRSFLYGYVIRWVALSTSTLTSLLVLQVLAGAIIAIVSTWICLRIFELPRWIAFIVGLLCCLDPIQLYWERAVMTETLSLLFYVLLLQVSFCYLKTKRIRDLLLIQLIAILMLTFRMSYLILVYVVTVALPLMAFWPWGRRYNWKDCAFNWLKKPALGVLARPAAHCFVSVATMYVLHSSYQHINGSLSHREPRYLYVTGTYLLSFWAPALKPSDAPNSRLAEVIRQGNTFSINQLKLRSSQLYLKGFLIDKLNEIEPNRRRAERLARETALRALKRDPLAIARLGWQTYLEFWLRGVHAWARPDVPTSGQWSELDIAAFGLTERFHQVVIPKNVRQPITFLAWYYFAAEWYYYVVLLSPVILGILVVLGRTIRRYLVFLFLNQTVLFVTTFTLSVRPVVRYLEPLSLITLLTFAAAAKCFMDRKHKLGSRGQKAARWPLHDEVIRTSSSLDQAGGQANNLEFASSEMCQRLQRC